MAKLESKTRKPEESEFFVKVDEKNGNIKTCVPLHEYLRKEEARAGQTTMLVESMFNNPHRRKEVAEAALEQLDYDELLSHIMENGEFWTEASDKAFLFRMLDNADWDEVKEWLQKESQYRMDRTNQLRAFNWAQKLKR